MISKTVLVYVPGWPLRWESFLPKAHLARLAACEIALGREAEIFDYGTPSSLECFTDHLGAYVEQMTRSAGNGRLGWLRTRNARGRLLAVCGKWHRELAVQIVESRAGKIVYFADTRDEYREARSVAAIVGSLLPDAVQTICGAHASGYVPYVAGGANVFEGVEHLGMPAPDVPLPEYDPSVYPALYAGGKLHQFTVSGNAKRVVAEISHCQRFVPARTFHVEDRGGLASARDLASEIMGSRVDAWYSRRLRPGNGAEGIARLLEASGCRCIDFPLMSGSQRLIEDYFGLSHGVSQARASLRACRAAGIFASLGLVYPCPFDDRHTCAESLLFMDQTLPDAVKVSFPELRYGGRWTDAPEDYGFQVSATAMARWASACDTPQFLPVRAPRPYRMGGIGERNDDADHDALLAEAKARGAALDMTAQEALVARTAGWEDREQAWKHSIGGTLIKGDFAGLYDHIEAFDRHACRNKRKITVERESDDFAAVAN